MNGNGRTEQSRRSISCDMGDAVQLDTIQESVMRQERKTAESIEHILALFRNVALADRETTRILKLRQLESVEDL